MSNDKRLDRFVTWVFAHPARWGCACAFVLFVQGICVKCSFGDVLMRGSKTPRKGAFYYKATARNSLPYRVPARIAHDHVNIASIIQFFRVVFICSKCFDYYHYRANILYRPLYVPAGFCFHSLFVYVVALFSYFLYIQFFLLFPITFYCSVLFFHPTLFLFFSKFYLISYKILYNTMQCVLSRLAISTK